MKFFLSILITSIFLVSPRLSEVRKNYVVAVNNKEVTFQLNEELSKINKQDDKILVAYKGSVLTLMAKFTKTSKDKKAFFKEGASLLEYAVSEDSNNIEIRYLRLGVQENAPKVVGYRKNKEEDKQFILDHLDKITSKELKDIVKDFMMQSETFHEDEKN